MFDVIFFVFVVLGIELTDRRLHKPLKILYVVGLCRHLMAYASMLGAVCMFAVPAQAQHGHKHQTPTPTPTPIATGTPIATPTSTPTSTPTATVTPTTTPAATPTATATPTVAPTVTPTPNPTPPDNTFLTGLYAYFKLDEISGAVTDASGNGKNLSNFGDAIGSATGIISGARDFDGVSGTTLIRNANTTDFFCGGNQFSFSFWVKFDTLPVFNDIGLCNRYEPYGRREYIVYLKQSTRKISFGIDDGFGAHSAAVSWSSTVSTGVWYHVAGGWDGTNIKVSINAGTFVTAPYSTPMTNGGDNFKLGYEAASLDGKMDEFGFWIGRCLTQTEVEQLYNNGAGLPFSSFH